MFVTSRKIVTLDVVVIWRKNYISVTSYVSRAVCPTGSASNCRPDKAKKQGMQLQPLSWLGRYVTESISKNIRPQMPICNVYAVHIDEMSWERMYRCPVYVTSNRGSDYVFAANVRIHARDTDIRWILAGCALLLAAD